MPLKFGAKMTGDMPPDLMAATEQADAAVGDELAGLVPPPEKPYSPRVVTALAQSVAKLLSQVGIEGVEVETYTGPVASLEPDDVRFLAMLAQMAADYGQPLPVGLGQIRGDSELTAITAHLTGLAGDPGFKAFLDEDAAMGEELSKGMGPDEELDAAMGGEGEDEGEEVEVEVKVPAGKGKGPGKGKGDDLFMSRMRR